MRNNSPRLLIAGTNSGCGKTTVTSAILMVLKKRGLSLCAFKCGPDYIDPMFHRVAIGTNSYNLDLFLSNENHCKQLLSDNIPQNGYGIIEGVMGLYDGISGTTEIASTNHVSVATDTPTILVVKPKGQSLSLGAVLHGFVKFKYNNIKGVIFNGISEGMYPIYKKIASDCGLESYGYLPFIQQSEIPSRHLGLVTTSEICDIKEKLNELADKADKTIDIDRMLNLADTAKPLSYNRENNEIISKKQLKIAVAMDNAFNFYYQSSLNTLQKNNVKLIYFSPLKDEEIPKNVCGLYIGGGYPELYAEKLSKNKKLLSDIKSKIDNGLPTIAECGGFLYLHRELITSDGISYKMADVIPSSAKMTNRLQNFGYITLTAKKDGLIANTGDKIYAHEFHYAKSINNGMDFNVTKSNGKSWREGYMTDTLYAGYPHLYLASHSDIVKRYINQCRRYGGYDET